MTWTEGNDELRLCAEDARAYAELPAAERARLGKIGRVNQLRRRLSIIMGNDARKPWNGEKADAIARIAEELASVARDLYRDAPAEGRLKAPERVEDVPRPVAVNDTPEAA